MVKIHVQFVSGRSWSAYIQGEPNDETLEISSELVRVVGVNDEGSVVSMIASAAQIESIQFEGLSND
ncbi:hypothetical protein ACQ4M3_19310 [Leptolyngbya sp. AN03gr2]|uniref:hypothetical protein n=1 Tax=Leptolyngbya sp. AN03gr2 TaxID=3423364 RepID=UPI003D312D83